jgi:tetratricopeptide (TPR) repeat protein
MNSACRVSVIIPCFNAAAYLPGAVRSILDQGIRETEIIIVDDHSTDDSRAVAESLAAQFSEVRSLRQPESMGPAAARNAGLRAAGGRCVCFLDADDEYAPGFFAKVLPQLEKDTEIAAVLTGIEIVDCDREIHPIQMEAIRNSIPSNLMIRKAVADFLGGFPESKSLRGKAAGEDSSFKQAVGTWFKIVHFPDLFLRHRFHRGSHLEYFLDRTRIDDGKLVFTSYSAEEVSGEKRRAKEAYWDQVAERVAVLASIKPLPLARMYHQAGNLRQAEQIYRQILQAEPGQAEVWYLLAAACQALGRSDEANASLQQGVRLQPHLRMPEALREQLTQAAPAASSICAQEHNSLGVALARQARPAEAAAHFKEAVRLQPDFAEAHNNLGNALLEQGQRNEAAASYRQALRLKPDCAEAHNNLGNLLRELGQFVDAVAHCQEAVHLRPDFAEAHNNLGSALQAQGKLDRAVACYQQALDLRPNYAEAHNNMGAVAAQQQNFDQAMAHFKQALAFQPGYADAYNHLGLTWVAQGRFQQAVACYQQAIALKPDFAEAHNNLGYALKEQGRFDEALASFLRALRLKPDYADAHWNRSLIWLAQGDFRQGWPEYEWRWKLKDLPPPTLHQPRWDGSDLNGRTILLHAEQGLGDVLQFIRYAPLVRQRGGRVILACPQSLLPLLARCAGIDQILAKGSPLPPFDVHAPLLSLPGLFRTTLADIPASVPYLYPDPGLVEHWRRQLSTITAFKVGIVWQGNPKHKLDRQRSIPLRHFEALARIPGVQLFSLQKGAGTEQIEVLQGRFSLIDLGSRLDQTSGAFMDTAAVMHSLDLVVTSDTAIAHLAGGLGVPVWLALPFVADWRWLLDRDDSPWYPSMRLFRQTRPGDWDDVFQRLAAAIESSQQSDFSWSPKSLSSNSPRR